MTQEVESGGEFGVELVEPSALTAHPDNYNEHPEEQLREIADSLEEHGAYRNVVVASDGTILAGHGVVAAAKLAGLSRIPVYRMPFGPQDVRALKLIAFDNEVTRLGRKNDTKLTQLLKRIQDEDSLKGTAYDDEQLRALLLLARPDEKIPQTDERKEWERAGMPAFGPEGKRIQLVLAFPSEEARDKLVAELELTIAKKYGATWSAWYPPRPHDDLSSVMIEGEKK